VGLVDGRAQWLLLARSRDGVLHRATLHALTPEDGWPESGVVVTGDHAIVSLGDEPPLDLRLDASLDARPPETNEEPEEDAPPVAP
jgi:hypothetical protein